MSTHKVPNQFCVCVKAIVFVVAVMTLGHGSANLVSAQETEIEIINQDGERVKGARLMLKQKPNPVKAEGVDDGKARVAHPLIKSEDGMLTYTDDDGKEQQVDLNRARSVSVKQSSQSVSNNGQLETKLVRKAVVVDAVGQRHEIDLGDRGGEELDLGGMPAGFPKMVSAKRNANKFMIGVHSGEVAPALRAQLGLEEGSGLLVNSIAQDSPAAAAGLKKFDVLLFADDQELLQQEDLLRMVQKAGKNSAAISLTVMRGGKEIGVDISPVERTAEQMRGGFPGGMNGFKFDFGDLDGRFGKGFGDLEFKQFGPGVILGGDVDGMDDMREQMQQVQQQMQEMQQRMQQRMRKQLNPEE